jgi:putative endonuclease
MKEPGHNNTFGKLGEDIAVTYLQNKGYRVRERNYRHSRAELDIIAEHGKEIVFIEVKTRSSDMMAYPEQAVGKTKQRNIRLAAEAFMEKHNIALQARFDIVAVVKGEKFEIEHIEDAFYPFDAL